MNILMVLSAPNVALGGNVTHPLRECFHTAADDISCSVRGKQTGFEEPTATLGIILNWRHASQIWFNIMRAFLQNYPDSKVHRANMGPVWGRQDPGGLHVCPTNFAFWVTYSSDFDYV